MNEIGIFLSLEKWQQLEAGQYNSGLKELVRAAEALNFPILWFSLPQDRLGEGLLLGATHSDRIFKLGYYPFPQVVYDLGVFESNYRVEKNILRQTLARSNVQFVNTRSAFSKWTTYSFLSTDSIIASYLPKTVKFETARDLEQMLSVYPKVCVKSIWGSRGKEVIFVEKWEDHVNLLFPNGHNQPFSNLDALVKEISSFMKGEKWVIQQMIDLATWGNHCFDLRVLVQKISLQRWVCTPCLRIAQQGRCITSTGQGGKVCEASPVLSELWPTQYSKILDEVEYLSLNVAQALENHHGPLGELGMDVGIDRCRRIWLFEVNGKPGKVTTRRLGNQHNICLAYERPLRYAALLLEEK